MWPVLPLAEPNYAMVRPVNHPGREHIENKGVGPKLLLLLTMSFSICRDCISKGVFFYVNMLHTPFHSLTSTSGHSQYLATMVLSNYIPLFNQSGRAG